MHNLLVVDSWLEPKDCELLIADGDAICPTNRGRVFHGGRHYIPNTSRDWNGLVKASEAWRSLEERLAAPEFLAWIVSELATGEDENDLELVQIYGGQRTKFEYLLRGDDRQDSVGPCLRLSRRLHQAQLGIRRRLAFQHRRVFRQKTATELLCDYSRATDGYGRVVHRDSDLRRYVFLLYLNSLDNGATGGDLDIYRPIDGLAGSPAWPNEDQCLLESSVKPAQGRLIVFRNAHDSYHGVATMRGHRTVRHFVYGGFTQLGGRNPNMAGSDGSIPTEFHLYS